ncbi:putative NAD-dependant dehydrogenase [Chrysochromulina ericina virus CeV-01B]|uniref:NAD-dependant dehydrogenase n=1 Tax=Chrysochromulina ericina virus CeV-01B TaxID=3070830 RepID=A0A0N9QWN7_9VIRU|nr:UDP-glucose dehydrogenase [Chrysochromulina ericina virus]ALH22912.1 putative NAD-dependant dehydrogenase [Chrysochromulina ericina virus CeV-01B]
MNKIGIIGIGFVGYAIKSFFENKIETVCYDKFKDFNTLKDILTTDFVFLCLPTLFDNNKNAYDKSAIYEVCDFLNINKYKGIIILKSTVEPETTAKLSEKYNNLKIFHNPEFLTARTALEDFANQKHIVIGKGPNCNDEDVKLLEDVYRKYFSKTEISCCSSIESESMKIMCNSFYASKIMLFNEYYLLSKKNGSDFEKIKGLMLKNKWINPMHTDVPGSDGLLAYGGGCFPKDTQALYKYMESYQSENMILSNVINECKLLRKE